MLVTISEHKAIQFRDLDVDMENGTAVVLETSMLKVKLKDELRRLGYSGNVDQHVSTFIHGLFGKGNMMLFGCGKPWKFEFDTEENFPSMLQLKHGKELVPVVSPVPVTGCGETIKKE